MAPNPTNATGGDRHKASDVTHWSYFLIDMDPLPKPEHSDDCALALGGGCDCPVSIWEKPDPQAAMAEALIWLGEWTGRDFREGKSGLPLIIDSGRGVQAWIRLADIVLDDRCPQGKLWHSDDDVIHRKTARRVNGYWLKKLDERLGVCHGCRIDTSVSDLPRVMRCPGTRNVKTGRKARFLHLTDHRFYGLAELLVTGTPDKAMEDPEPPAEITPGRPWQEVFSHLTLTAQTYLLRGQAEPGRHKVMWHTAKKLRELGVTREEARRALKYANRLAGKDERLPPDQIKHALDTAYGN